MARTRTLVIGDTKVFDMGIVALLQSESDLDILSLSSGDPELFVKIQTAQLQTVIVLVSDQTDDLSLVTQILRQNPGVKIIYMALGSDEINVYQSRRIPHPTTNELLAAIKS